MNMAGSIYKRKDGRWAGQVSLGSMNGKRKTKTVYGKTRSEVVRKLEVLTQRYGLGVDPLAGRQALSEFAERWLEETVRPTRAANTYSGYRNVIRNHINPALGHLQLEKLTPQHVQTFLNSKRAELSVNMVRYIRVVLGVVLRQAVDWGYVSRNVASLARPPQPEKPDHQVLSSEQVRQLLQAAHGERLGALYLLAVGLGLRKSELLSLRWSDIDFEQKTLHIRKGKTKAAERTLTLSAPVLAALQSHWEEQAERKGYVFTNAHGGMLAPTSLDYQFKKLLRKAQLPAIRFHDLRHTCASLLYAQGVPSQTISKILGHTNITTTLNIYTHVSEEGKARALETLDSLLTVK